MSRQALRRNATTFEFVVRYPHGTSAINGYRQAARHFGFHTLEDPTTAGGDDTRVLIHRSASVLRRAARRLSKAWTSDLDGAADEGELWLATESGVSWFHHDWNYWDADQDNGALESLGWRRRISAQGDDYRVTLTTRSRRDSSKGRRRG
jgi:hypothetical protein